MAEGEIVTDYPRPLASLPLHESPIISVSSGAITSSSRRRLSSTARQTTMYHMLGSFYSHIWVGTPPQRVSVIVDTGSHHTAFPCVGCKCGKHMDPYFDPMKSATSSVPVCAGSSKCYFKQSYSEGSSWHAYKVRDKVWVGGESLLQGPNASNLSTQFEFGCQETETGLFRTQFVDGIMGLAGAHDTLPHVLHAKGIAQSKVFAMCFRLGGGILSLGGVDTSVHKAPLAPILYAKQMARKPAGWFGVRLLDVLLRHSKTGETKSIGLPVYKYNTGKGAIIDSGTTDTYLPSSCSHSFSALFQQFSGITYSNTKRDLTAQELESLPTVIYVLEDMYGKPMRVESLPSAYTETIVSRSNFPSSQPRYAFRIYPTEPSGTVLGANFMLGHNVIFDFDGRRVGFAPSDCRSTTPTAIDANTSTIRGTGEAVGQIKHGNASPSSISPITGTSKSYPLSASMTAPRNVKSQFQQLDNIYEALSNDCSRKRDIVSLSTACTATCLKPLLPSPTLNFVAAGIQEWSVRDACSNSSLVKSEPCHVICSAATTNQTHPRMLRELSNLCVADAWSHCTTTCSQERSISASRLNILVVGGEETQSTGGCKSLVEKRSCHAYKCPIYASSQIAFNIKIYNIDVRMWSFIYEEDLIYGLSRAFDLHMGLFHVYSGPFSAGLNAVSLHLQLRLPTDQHGGKEKTNNLGDSIVKSAKSPSFPTALSLLLNGNDTRSGTRRWLRAKDLEVVHANADFIDSSFSSSSSSSSSSSLGVDRNVNRIFLTLRGLSMSYDAGKNLLFSAFIVALMSSIFFVWRALSKRIEVSAARARKFSRFP